MSAPTESARPRPRALRTDGKEGAPSSFAALVALAALVMGSFGCEAGESPGQTAASPSANPAAAPTPPLPAVRPTANAPANPASISPVPANPAAANPAAADPAEVARLCAATCAATSALACPKAGLCVEGCRQSFSAPVCGDLFLAFLECSSKEPVARWECGPAGVPALREGACEREQEAIIRCITAPR